MNEDRRWWRRRTPEASGKPEESRGLPPEMVDEEGNLVLDRDQFHLLRRVRERLEQAIGGAEGDDREAERR